MLIRTANDQFIVIQMGGYREFVETVVKRNWAGAMAIDWDRLAGAVMAEVVRSDWRVKCPFCAGAQVIEPGEPFFCVDCLMQANGFRPMRVTWPENRDDIERVLLHRPDPLTRNWLPGQGETVDLLRLENQQHGHGAA